MRVRRSENCRIGITVPVLVFFVLSTFLAVPRAATAASSTPAAWNLVPLPAAGEAGHWALAPGTTLGYLTRAVDGTVYAFGDGPTRAIFCSADGGASWTIVKTLSEAVVALAASPADPDVLYYATVDTVRRSPDRGASFITLEPSPGGSGLDNRRITSLAVTRAEGWEVAVGVADDDPGEYGGVWTMAEYDGSFTWNDTGAGPLDVLAVAFSPSYPTDREMVAVATDETVTEVMFRSGTLPWHAVTQPAVLHPDNGAAPVVATTAALAFPGIADDQSVVYAGIATGAGGGDVYRVTVGPGTAAAVDLNAGSAAGLTNLDITTLSVGGSYPQLTISAGSSSGSTVYTSRDAGLTWGTSLKSPPGTSVTSVLAADDSLSSPLLAVTAGSGGGLSRSRDAGISWDQVSFIDTTLDTIVDLAPSPSYETDGTLFLLTFGSGTNSLWRTRDGGAAWERVLWTGTAGVANLDFIGLPPGYGTGNHVIYTAGESDGTPTVWLSRDDGRTFDRRPTLDPATGAAFVIDAWAIAGENTLFIAGYDGSHSYIYRTDNAGFRYLTGIAAGTQPVTSLAATDTGTGLAILTGTSAGQVYLARDDAAAFQPLPATPPTGLPDAPVSVAFDADFATNGIAYAASAAVDGGIYRFHTNADVAWEAIDGTVPAGSMIARLLVSPGGVLYAVDSAPNTGMERSLEPVRANPSFATIGGGLPSGTTLHGLWQAGSSLWSIDTSRNRLWRFDDTLTRPVQLDQPADAATECGTVSGQMVNGMRLAWEAVAGATSYEWRCSYDDTFGTASATMNGTLAGSSVSLPGLRPATTYYWRVRVVAPAPGPWSATRSFTTCLVVEPITLQPDTPVPGATDVPVRPLFHWTAVVGAESYELLVAEDMDFATPIVARVAAAALPTNAWASDTSLAPATTYYWKVRALTAGSASAWSATGIFTTVTPASTGTPLPSVTPTPEATSNVPGQDAGSDLRVFSPITPPPATTVTVPAAASGSPPPVTVLYEPEAAPAWLLYTIGGLLASIILTLAVLFVMVLKIRGR